MWNTSCCLQVHLTFAGSRREADAQHVLETQHARQEVAVPRPHRGDALPAATRKDGDEAKGVADSKQIHPLTNHVHRQKEAGLRRRRRVYVPYDI